MRHLYLSNVSISTWISSKKGEKMHYLFRDHTKKGTLCWRDSNVEVKGQDSLMCLEHDLSEVAFVHLPAL